VNRAFVSGGELLVMAAVLLLAVFIYIFISVPGPRHSGAYAVISVGGYPDIRLSLGEDAVFVLPQNPNVTFRIAGGEIAFASSCCPDQICVRTGTLHRQGQSAACLPNRVLLTLRAPGGVRRR